MNTKQETAEEKKSESYRETKGKPKNSWASLVQSIKELKKVLDILVGYFREKKE